MGLGVRFSWAALEEYVMKHKRTKPKPTSKKNYLSSSEYNDHLEFLSYLDYLGDIERREWKNSSEYLKRKKLADKWKK